MAAPGASAEHDPPLDAVFGALAHPARRAIVERLADGEATISELARPFDMSLPAVSRHLRVLSDAGLVQREKRGRDHHCRLVQEPLLEAIAWMAQYGAFWGRRPDTMAELVGGPGRSSTGRPLGSER